ncbi:MAG: ATP-binding protein [Synechococcus sp.]
MASVPLTVVLTEKLRTLSFVPPFRWADFNLPSTLQLSPLLELLIEPVTCEQTAFRVELGLQEALVNAVRHGNGGDCGKSLRVRRILTPHWLVWQIQDEGAGLPVAARDGHLPQRPDAARGRGLFLIHQCFDDVRWSRRGNRLQVACRKPIQDIVRMGDGDNQDPSVPA